MSDFLNHLQHSGNETFFVCPKCRVQTPLHDFNRTVVFACRCDTVYWKEDFQRYQKLNNHFSLKDQKLSIGDKGEHEGNTYTVIGIAHKREQRNPMAKWTEFVLIDQHKKISFLNCCYGNYTWMFPSDRIQGGQFVGNPDDYITFEGEEYELLSSYKMSSESIRGEFHYNPVDIKKIQSFDFIAPPKAIIIEQRAPKVFDCFEGSHFSRAQISEIFKKPAIAYQNHDGIGMAQPYFLRLKSTQINRTALFFSLLMLLISIFWTIGSPEQKLLYSRYAIATQEPAEIVTNSFVLSESVTPYYLQFSGSSSLWNEWLELGITLVNEETGVEKEVGFVIEYYSGVTDGYSWSEGSNFGSVNLSGVPAGKYHLKIQPYCSINEVRELDFSARIASPVWWNFGMMFLCIFLITIILNILNRQVRRLRSGEIDNLFGSGNHED